MLNFINTNIAPLKVEQIPTCVKQTKSLLKNNWIAWDAVEKKSVGSGSGGKAGGSWVYVSGWEITEGAVLAPGTVPQGTAWPGLTAACAPALRVDNMSAVCGWTPERCTCQCTALGEVGTLWGVGRRRGHRSITVHWESRETQVTSSASNLLDPKRHFCLK